MACEGRWVCENCGKRFDRDKSGSRPIRFCSRACTNEWRKSAGGNAGSFSVGAEPWNKGKTGLRLSPATEWKKGRTSERKLPVGSVRIRQRKREKHPRAFIKIAEPSLWVPRAIHVWEAAHGPIPRGLVLHHKDRDPLNDDLENLVLLTRSEHAAEHNQELHNARYGRR